MKTYKIRSKQIKKGFWHIVIIDSEEEVLELQKTYDVILLNDSDNNENIKGENLNV
jgi:hypothetical protein